MRADEGTRNKIRKEKGKGHCRASLAPQRGGGGASDLNPNTLLRWLEIRAFRDAYGQTTARLQQGATAAASTLLKVMLDPSTPASTKVRAAESVLNHA